MSTIFSKIDSLDRLRFEPITAKSVKVVRMTAIDSTVVALGADGVIYTNAVRNHVSYRSHGDNGALSRLLDGCIKLKVLTANAVRQHKDDVTKRMAKREFVWESKRLVECAEKLGIELTSEQLAKIHNGD